MNRLSTDKRGQIIGCLTEGMSMRAASRVSGVARNTIDKLLIDLGEACAEHQDGALANLAPVAVECDEIWSFNYAKAKNVPEDFKGTFGYTDVSTWTAIDAERTTEDCYAFLADLKSRLLPGHRF
jgi:lambda repressor-like predicted transcriptional regulator